MKEGNAIEVRDITKTFKVYLDKSNDVKSFMIHSNRRRYEKRQVLRGISFDVKKGEAIGLIGHNGCGKSTTLKLLTRIMYPDAGSIEIKGRVSSLIELGAGFHPDMSGRENIYINASIFGLSKKEIDQRVDDIIRFSELEEFIDNPVRTYSSGMYMRLAFSVAINVDADVLLIDEILAVGDVAFQAKCFNKLKEIKAQGTTIVIVSHSLGQIEQICERSYWIHEGLIKMSGSPREVHPYYLDYMGGKKGEALENSARKRDSEKKKVPDQSGNDEVISDTDQDRKNEASEIKKEKAEKPKDDKHFGSQEAVIDNVRILDKDGREKSVFSAGQKIIIEMDCHSVKEIPEVVFGIAIYTIDNIHMFGTNTSIDRQTFGINGKVVIRCIVDSLSLGEGEYKLDVAIHTIDGFNFDFWKDYLRFKVYKATQEVGLVYMNRKWEIKKEK